MNSGLGDVKLALRQKRTSDARKIHHGQRQPGELRPRRRPRFAHLTMSGTAPSALARSPLSITPPGAGLVCRPTVQVHEDVGLEPADDRSSNRNEHPATRRPHPAQPASPSRGPGRVCSSQGPPPSSATDEDLRAQAERVPLLRVARGQQRSLTSPSDEYPQVSIRAGQDLDRCPIFQAGAHV